jgi:hypothetical protein
MKPAMNPTPESKPARKRPMWVAFLLGIGGIVLLNEAADSWHVHGLNAFVAVEFIAGLAGVVWAVLWGNKRI